ncbi:hypothetical protein Lepto7375DRAFT_1871 [Leptolyngbya sp. PCC 7375]|nr:hypothetical protein Lepto7375DRAFT_1871 [Leptolyngbya sp. PCC 7375]
MKKDSDNNLEDTLRPEYDFAQMQGSVRGKYIERYRQGTNLVLLDPDVAQAFPKAEDVNEALRLLMKLAQRQQALIQNLDLKTHNS